MIKKFIRALLLFFILGAHQEARAQRYLPGQIGWQLSGGFLDNFKLFKKEDRSGYHLNLAVSKYTAHRNRWLYNAYFSEKKYRNGASWHKAQQYAGDISYWVPLWENRGKDVFFSLGAGGSLGYENTENMKSTDNVTFKNRFLYGGFLGAEMEFFLSDRWIFILNARERYMRKSDLKDFHMNLGAGVKYIFNY